MTAASGNAVLLTCDTGVLRLNIDTGVSNWELPLSGCFGPALSQSNEAFLVTCGSAVVAWDGRALTAAAGCFKPRSQLLPGLEGECWMFSTTGPTGHPYCGAHTLTRLGPGVGEEHPYAIQFDGIIEQIAVTARNTLYVASTFTTADLEIAGGMGLDTSPGTQAFVGAGIHGRSGAAAARRTHRVERRPCGSRGRSCTRPTSRTREHTLLFQVAASSATAASSSWTTRNLPCSCCVLGNPTGSTVRPVPALCCCRIGLPAGGHTRVAG
ncbi:hypothetical protein ACRAWF_09570 [Streptomyces sp. L7]